MKKPGKEFRRAVSWIWGIVDSVGWGGKKGSWMGYGVSSGRFVEWFFCSMGQKQVETLWVGLAGRKKGGNRLMVSV
jgi:hypothetical protein